MPEDIKYGDVAKRWQAHKYGCQKWARGFESYRLRQSNRSGGLSHDEQFHCGCCFAGEGGAIIRGVEFSECIKVAEALYAGGIRLMEVTFALDKPELFRDSSGRSVLS